MNPTYTDRRLAAKPLCPRGAKAAGGQPHALVREVSDTRTRTPTRMPEGKDLEPFGVRRDSVVEVVPDATKEDAANSSEARIACDGTDLGMERD